MVTRKENIETAVTLVEKEQAGTLNVAENKLLQTYRSMVSIRDTTGAVYFYEHRILQHDAIEYDGECPKSGVLYVL